MTDLSAVFRPRAIAVVGASDDPVKIGGRPLAFLLRHGYAGRVFPVNPARATVQGLPAFPSIGAIPEAVDLAIVVVPAERVLESLEEAAAKGVRAAIVFSSGFAEVGDAGRVAQARLRELAERTGLRIIGPNCQGFAHLPSRLVATFASPFLEPGLATGPIAMVSQSGAMAGMIYEMARAAGLGLNYWVSTGNEADVQAAEILAEVVEDEETRVACCYLEDIKDAGRFRRALARAHRRGVPVFVLKSGRSAVGRRAASSHTGALAGEDAVYDAVFADWGAIRCADPAELLALPQAFLRYREAGHRVAILSNSGGLGVLSVDLCVDLALAPAEFTPETTAVAARGTAGLRGRGQPGGPHRPDAHRPGHAHARAAGARGRSGRGRHRLPDRPARRRDRSRAAGRRRGPRSPAATRQGRRGELSAASGRRRLSRRAGCSPSRTRSVALARSPASPRRRARRARWLDRATPRGMASARARAVGTGRPSGAEPFLNEWESQRLLAPFGLPLVDTVFVTAARAAPDAAEQLGYPVVVKACAAALPHKSDVGGVALGLSDRAAVADACRRIEAQRARGGAGPRARWLPDPAPGARRARARARGQGRSRSSGRSCLVGSGGVLIEVLRDFRLLLPPIDAGSTAEEALRSTAHRPAVGRRARRGAADLPAAVELLERLGEAARSTRRR